MGKFEDKLWHLLREAVLDADMARADTADTPTPH